jgi:hypothetical protein
VRAGTVQPAVARPNALFPIRYRPATNETPMMTWSLPPIIITVFVSSRRAFRVGDLRDADEFSLGDPEAPWEGSERWSVRQFRSDHQQPGDQALNRGALAVLYELGAPGGLCFSPLEAAACSLPDGSARDIGGSKRFRRADARSLSSRYTAAASKTPGVDIHVSSASVLYKKNRDIP